MNGPSDQTLARLASMLPSIVEGRQDGSFAPRPGGKLCTACGKVFGRPTRDNTIKKDVCKPCKKHLKEGGTIFISTDNRVFSFMPKEGASVQVNPKWRGRIVQIPVEMMDGIDKLLTPNAEM